MQKVFYLAGGVLLATAVTFFLTDNQPEPLTKFSQEVNNPQEPELRLESHTTQMTSPISAYDSENNINHDSTDNSQSMVTMERPTWKFESRLISKLQNLTEDATGGDPESAYILAMNLRYCYYAEESQQLFEEKLRKAYAHNEAESSINNKIERFEYCQGVDRASINRFYQFFEQAAESKFVPALEVIGAITSKQFMNSQGYSSLERDDFIAKRNAFQKLQITYLHQAAQQGSVRALSRLSNLYHSQKFGEHGLLKSYAMNEMVLALTQDNELFNRYSWMQQRLFNKLAPDELEQARAMAESWLIDISNNGQLYTYEN